MPNVPQQSAARTAPLFMLMAVTLATFALFASNGLAGNERQQPIGLQVCPPLAACDKLGEDWNAQRPTFSDTMPPPSSTEKWQCKDREFLVTRLPVQVNQQMELAERPFCVREDSIRKADP